MNCAKTFIAAICVVILLPTLHCQASSAADAPGDETDDRSFRVGVGIGGARISEDFVIIDDSSMAYKVFAGYEVNDFLSFEVSLLRFDSIYKYYPLNTPTQQAVADGHGINAAAALALPISSRFQLKGRAGFLHWSADASDADLDDSGTDLSVGLGIEYRFNDALSVHADYDVFQFGEFDTYVGTLSLSYRF